MCGKKGGQCHLRMLHQLKLEEDEIDGNNNNKLPLSCDTISNNSIVTLAKMPAMFICWTRRAEW